MKHFKRLLSYSGRYLWLNIAAVLFSLMAIAAGMATPYLTKLIVDDVLMAGHYYRLGYLAGLFLLMSGLRALTMYFRRYIFEFTSQKVIYNLRSEVYDKLQAQSFEFYDKTPTGLIMNRVFGDLESIRQLLANGYIQIIEGIVSFITTFSIMISMDVKLTFIMSIILPFLYLNTVFMAKALQIKYRRIRRSFERLSSAVQENITGIRVVKAFGKEEYEKGKFFKVAKAFTDWNIKAGNVRAKYSPMGQFINGVGAVIILLLGGYLVMKGEITIGTLVAFNSYMLMLSQPITHLTDLVNQWENAMASLEKIFSLIDQVPTIRNKNDTLVIKDVKGDVKFKKVYFKYNENYVLKDINLHLKPGSVTAIMGATGSGKSTIINLIARFYDCTKGKVLIDDIDVRDMDLNSLRRNIGIILQETFLFSDTIAANIAFGKPDATMEQIEKAARIADAHEFIMSMPNGYDTVVGERGVGLSGGQKQRIAIARAVLYDPKILILDDATSSVDMETEYEIQQTLKEVMKGRTTLIIAHRVSSVKDADEIIFLEDGAIVERGSHDELMAMKGRYYRTFIEQYREYDLYGDLADAKKMVVGGVRDVEKYL